MINDSLYQSLHIVFLYISINKQKQIVNRHPSSFFNN